MAKKLPKDLRAVVYSIRMTEYFNEKLVIAARKHDRTKSQMIRLILMAGLEKLENKYKSIEDILVDR